ncbi:Transcriptional activator NphR [Corynebacterium occultum]|uniref:Transcriptional activator NphR n=1 Tax=Corynebacterium occultum TaxID=2675219 RepID=A0A6B8W1V6_9CORY|nr:helix-turn-helix domain-containing protein [Corynebacterium occultum]QGU05987.1 Transcriptional activator NphR [Corynebacterium occultum]
MDFRKTYNFTEWRRMVSGSFGDVRAVSPAPDFRGRATHRSVGEVELYDMDSDAHTVIHAENTDPDLRNSRCKLSLQLEGTATLLQDGRSCEMQPGDLALYTADRPYSLVFREPQRSLVVYFPRAFLHLRDDQLAQMTATPISRDEGLGKVAVPLFEQLAHNLDELQGEQAQPLLRTSLDLLVTVLSDQIQRLGQDSPGSSMLFRQATAYINDHLYDPGLSPSSIADALYVSVRSLHTHFAAMGTTVASFIRTCRLTAIHADLADPALQALPVHVISARHGLHDASHVSKTFRAEYGESPRAFRSRIFTPHP